MPAWHAASLIPVSVPRISSSGVLSASKSELHVVLEAKLRLTLQLSVARGTPIGAGCSPSKDMCGDGMLVRDRWGTGRSVYPPLLMMRLHSLKLVRAAIVG